MKAKAQTSEKAYAAFLRGINVGGNSVITMDNLKKLFSKLGFKEVKTILASGNVVFLSKQGSEDTIRDLIAAELKKLMGREISVIVREVGALENIQSKDPLNKVKAGPKIRAFITFVPDYKKSMDCSSAKHHDFYSILLVSEGMVVSAIHDEAKGTLDLMEEIESKYGKKVTTRTWNTLEKVLKAADGITC